MNGAFAGSSFRREAISDRGRAFGCRGKRPLAAGHLEEQGERSQKVPVFLF